MTLPAAHRIHTSLALSNSLAAVPSPSDLATLALLAHPLSSSISTSLWDWANSLGSKQPAEQAVLQLDLTDAENLYRDGLTTSKEQKPLMVAAQTLVMNSLRVSVARAFVSTVNRSLSIESLGLELTDENSLREAVGDSTLALEVGKAVTGRAQQLALLWETYCRHQHLHADITDDMLDTLDQLRDEFEDVGADDDVLSLLRALILFSRVFPASSSSGEDTPTSEGVKPITTVVGARGKLHLDLRRALASAAFDTDGEVEDARDRVVDLLSTMSRRR